MTPERWRRIEELYHAALARDERDCATFLADACAGDEALRLEVESLLAQPASREAFLGERAVVMAARLVSGPGPSIPVGHRIGGYQVQAALGAGGMGVVYRATRMTSRTWIVRASLVVYVAVLAGLGGSSTSASSAASGAAPSSVVGRWVGFAPDGLLFFPGSGCGFDVTLALTQVGSVVSGTSTSRARTPTPVCFGILLSSFDLATGQTLPSRVTGTVGAGTVSLIIVGARFLPVHRVTLHPMP
jgi:hypothetical protein